MAIKRAQEPMKYGAQSLKKLDQWIPHNSKKQPLDPVTDTVCNAFDEENHLSFETAMRAHSRDNSATGVGFVLTKSDELVLVDLDGCLDANLEFTNAACREVFQQIDSYTEISVSEAGLHILATGYNLGNEYGHSQQAPIEMYDAKKFCTFSGAVVENRLEVRTQREGLKHIHQNYSPFSMDWINS